MQKETYLHLTVHGIGRAKGTSWSATAAVATAIAPVAASLTVGTVASHVACVATDTTDDVGGEVALLGAVVLAVSDLTTFLRVKNLDQVSRISE